MTETAVPPSEAPTEITGLPLVVRFSPVIELTEDQFVRFCAINGALRIERNARGELEIMPPTGGETGNRNFKLTARFGAWVERDGTGVGFDSSTAFTLPNDAVRSPDVSWIPRSRWEAIPLESREKFTHICPDFVVELRSPSDALHTVQDKLQEYIEHGARLGWLIDPIRGRLHVYRAGSPPEVLERPDSISGEPLLPGFELDLRDIW